LAARTIDPRSIDERMIERISLALAYFRPELLSSGLGIAAFLNLLAEYKFQSAALTSWTLVQVGLSRERQGGYQ
ncbi:hypothetical protein, partial [Serratia marcescens]